MKFTPNAHYFDFYSLQLQAEHAIHWLALPFLLFAVYKLLRVMTR